MERNIKAPTPGGRNPLRYEMDKEKNFRVAQQSTLAASDCQRGLVPEGTEDYCLTDEDDIDENGEEALSKLDSSDTSAERLLTSIRTRRTSGSPVTALSGKSQPSQENVVPENISEANGTTASSHTSKRPNDARVKRAFAWGLKATFFALGVILSSIYMYKFNGSSLVQSPQQNRFTDFAKDLREISRQFPKQDRRCWLDIRAGMEDLLNSSSKPWTFLFFSNETSTITRLAELLGKASSKALRAKNSLILKPEDMGDEYGDTIDRLRPRILENKAVVVHDLLNVDPGAVQAFHAMCDRENPLVKEAVYIITIIAPGYTSAVRPELFVENLLIETFAKRVDEDKLQPLVTRLTDGPIIPVVSENLPTGSSR